jgi:hypothetical protein
MDNMEKLGILFVLTLSKLNQLFFNAQIMCLQRRGPNLSGVIPLSRSNDL